LQGLEEGINRYLARYGALPPTSGAPVPVPDPAFGATGANYVNSAYLHYWLASQLPEFTSHDAGGPRMTTIREPLVLFQKSQASTWRALSDAGFSAGKFDAAGRVASPGFTLDPWGRAIAYVPLPAGAGDHSPATFSRPGAAQGRTGRNLTDFVQLWSRGADGATTLPEVGPAPNDASGDGDDMVLWFLPLY